MVMAIHMGMTVAMAVVMAKHIDIAMAMANAYVYT